MYELCKTSKLELRREVHLYMFKQCNNIDIVNIRNVNTRAHDALLFTTTKPNNEKYMQNVYYRGAITWNNLTVAERNIIDLKKFKEMQKKLFSDI